MGKLTVIIPDDLEKQFRLQIVERYNGKRGTLTKAVVDAITLWLKKTD